MVVFIQVLSFKACASVKADHDGASVILKKKVAIAMYVSAMLNGVTASGP